MMGINAGYVPGPALPERAIRQRWAWLPVRSNSEKWVWRSYYVHVKVYQDAYGNAPLESLYWNYIFTENEYLVWLLKNPARQMGRPPTTGSSVVASIPTTAAPPKPLIK